MKINARRIFYLLIAINIILVGAIAATFILANNIAGSKSKSIAYTKADIESNEQAISNLQTLERTVSQNKEIEEIAKKVLPQDKEQSAALAELDKFSKTSGVGIKQISFTPGKGGGLVAPTSLKGVSVISVNVHCDAARYDQLLSLLKLIENNQRRMQVTSVALTPSEITQGKLDKIDLALEIYLKP